MVKVHTLVYTSLESRFIVADVVRSRPGHSELKYQKMFYIAKKIFFHLKSHQNFPVSAFKITNFFCNLKPNFFCVFQLTMAGSFKLKNVVNIWQKFFWSNVECKTRLTGYFLLWKWNCKLPSKAAKHINVMLISRQANGQKSSILIKFLLCKSSKTILRRKIFSQP